MNRSALLAALGLSAAVALTPALASAGNACQRDRHDDRVAGTVIGALGGALLGNAVAAHGHRGDGALVGAVGGAIVGNQLSRSNSPCPDGYSYVHEERVTDRQGYYDVPPPPPPRYVYGPSYGYRTYDAPPPPPRYYEARWHHRHHEDEDDGDEHDHRRW